MPTTNQNSRPILVTGCSSGIGLYVARELHARGYHVYASARKAADVERLEQEGLICLMLDLDDSDSINSATNQLLEQTGGKIYGLFNNGGFGQSGAVEDLNREIIRQQFETNVFGWIELTNRLLPVMRKHGYGRIIQNSSVLGFAAMPYRGAYNASKYAIEGFSDTLRRELLGTQIFVSLIQPGPIESDFRKNALQRFLDTIDYKNSVHRKHYLAVLDRMQRQGPSTRFTLGPESVLKRVIHALESKRPRTRYPVTTPTYLFSGLRRVLPDSALDAILAKVH